MLAATGSTIHYLIEVTNDGPSVATNVVALDALPVEVDYLFDTANPTCAAGSGNERVCQLGDLAPGTSKSFEIYGRLADDIVSGTQLVNTVTVASDASPVVSASATVVVDSVADLSVRIFGTPNTTVRAGDVLSYTILVDNFGPGVAQAAQVASLITASGGYRFSGPAFCTPTSGSPAAGSQAVTCQLGAMNPNTQQQFVITLTANEEQTLQMSADVSSADSDPDLAYTLTDAGDTAPSVVGLAHNDMNGSCAD